MGIQKSKLTNKDPTVLRDEEVKLLELRTGLREKEIRDWHRQFLVSLNSVLKRKNFLTYSLFNYIT